MKNKDIYNILYKEISPLVNLIDPAALGGAINEYDNDINQIIRIIMLKKRPLSIEEIKKIFSENYKLISVGDAEWESLLVKIDNLIKNIYSH